MSKIEQLRRRMEQLETELEAVLRDTEALQRVRTRKKSLRRVISLAVAFAAFAAYWSLAAAAAPGPGTTVTAPFQVVDENNQLIFEVTSAPLRGFLLYGAAGGLPAGAGVVTDKAAFFKNAPTANGNIVLAVSGANPELKLRSAGERDQITLQALGGSPSLIMFNKSGHDIVQLRRGITGAGGLEINNSAGELRVLATETEGGYGRVEALPLGNPMGSFIVGKARH
jgi:hypothetical protein